MIKSKCLYEDFEGNGIIRVSGEDKKIPTLLKDEIGIFEAIKKGKYTNYHLLDIENKSKDRINSICPFYKECGGCQFLHMTYEHEIDLKNDYIKDLFSTVRNVEINDVVKMNNPYNYRNKCQMTYKLSKSKNVVCGFYEENTHKVVPVTDCHIQNDKAKNIIENVNKILTKNKIMPYDEQTRRGIIRHILLRFADKTNEIMLTLITNGEMFPGRKNVVDAIIKANLGITTIVQNYNSRDTSIVLGDRERVLYGPGFIYDYINDIKFKLSSKSFYQVNPRGMNELYNLIIKKSGIKKTDIVMDAYSGVGTIGILLSKYAKEVISVELNRDAHHDAIINAKINNIKNVKFFNDDSTKFIKSMVDENAKIDVLVLDPPRDGSTKEFIDMVGKLKPRSVIYVSCEPTSLKRDLFEFTKNNYKVVSISPVDMFPRTFNLETVCLLVKK